MLIVMPSSQDCSSLSHLWTVDFWHNLDVLDHNINHTSRYLSWERSLLREHWANENKAIWKAIHNEHMQKKARPYLDIFHHRKFNIQQTDNSTQQSQNGSFNKLRYSKAFVWHFICKSKASSNKQLVKYSCPLYTHFSLNSAANSSLKEDLSTCLHAKEFYCPRQRAEWRSEKIFHEPLVDCYSKFSTCSALVRPLAQQTFHAHALAKAFHVILSNLEF